MITEGSIVVDRQIEDVFDYTTSNVAEWSDIVIEEEMVEEKPDGVGSKFRTVTEDRGRRMEFLGETLEHNRPKLSRVFLRGDAFEMDVEYRFEELSGKTRVSQKSNVKGKGMFRVLLPVMGVLMRKSGCRALQKELENLKRCCEDRYS